MLRPAAATWTEEAEGGDRDRNESDARERLRGEPEDYCVLSAAEKQQGASLV